MLGLACLSVAENLEESGLDGWFTASLRQHIARVPRVGVFFPLARVSAVPKD